MNLPIKALPVNAAAVLTLLLATLYLVAPPSYAGNIYLWYTMENGKKVPNYGENPPLGVQATLVSNEPTPPSAPPQAANPSAADTNPTEQQQALKAQREEDCKYEKSRLSTLKSSGSRIRMEQDDGTSRYLSPEEIAAEIKQSEDFISQGCS